MGWYIDMQQAQKVNALLDQMRAALQSSMAGRKPADSAQAMAELDALISAAIKNPSQMGWRQNDCSRWCHEVNDALPAMGYVHTAIVHWLYYPFWNPVNGFLAHFAIMVTLPDGTVFYLDDGWWGPAFTPSDEPPWPNVRPQNGQP